MKTKQSNSSLISEKELEAAVLSYVLAPDWIEARKAVETNSLLLTDEAIKNLHPIIMDFIINKFDLNPSVFDLSSLLIADSIILLKMAQTNGVTKAFQFRAEQDNMFLKLLHEALDRTTLSIKICENPDLLNDDADHGLQILLIRSFLTNNENRSNQIRNFFTFFNECRDTSAKSKAEEISAMLISKDPKNTTPDDVSECYKALAFIAREEPSQLWADLKIRLGILIFELPGFETNIKEERAAAEFRDVLKYFPHEKDKEIWKTATHELLLCLLKNPAAIPSIQNESDKFFAELENFMRSNKDDAGLASLLSNYGSSIVDREICDPVEIRERALSCCMEAVELARVVATSNINYNKQLGRFLHNLGVVYLKRIRGIRSQNIDSAINAFHNALEFRDADSDPSGRVRTLCALASAYPEWSAPDSKAEAIQKSRLAYQEADYIKYGNNRVASEILDPAIDLDLFNFFQETSDPQTCKDFFLRNIQEHKDYLSRLSRDSQPVLWAKFMGGLGVLLTGLFHTENSQQYLVNEAYESFTEALDNISMENFPLTWLKITKRLGELAHMIGSWNTSFEAYSSLLSAADFLFQFAGADTSREYILKESRGAALFACYAAIKLNKLSEAVSIIEKGCANKISTELLISDQTISKLPLNIRRKVKEKKINIKKLEDELRNLEAKDPCIEIDSPRKRLTGSAGTLLNIPFLKLRITNPGMNKKIDSSASGYSIISRQIAAIRYEIREELRDESHKGFDVFSDSLSTQQISEIAKASGYPIIYLLSTSQGSHAIIVSPDQTLDSIELVNISSNDTRKLFYGYENFIGYRDVSIRGVTNNIRESLNNCISLLHESVVEPIEGWLKAKGYKHAYLVPLGSLGLLPLTTAFYSTGLTVNIIPSARMLDHCIKKVSDQSSKKKPILLAIGNPIRKDKQEIPLTSTTVKAISKFFKGEKHSICKTEKEATLKSFKDNIGKATHLYFACHSRIYPNDLLSSGLLLNGEDELTIGQLFQNPEEYNKNIKLVVLSACQTIVKESEELPDESINLPSGFLLTGVPSVVCTLWPVKELVSSMFSLRFYHELIVSKKSVSLSVAAARNWLKTAKANEVLAEINDIKKCIPPDDSSYKQLTKFSEQLNGLSGNEKVFSGIEYWGAFAAYGI